MKIVSSKAPINFTEYFFLNKGECRIPDWAYYTGEKGFLMVQIDVMPEMSELENVLHRILRNMYLCENAAQE